MITVHRVLCSRYISGVYPHSTSGHMVNVKWFAKKDVDDLRERPYVYEAVVSIGTGKSAKTIRIRETDPEEAHRKIEQKINQFFSDRNN